jgi:hypothetical protein
VSDDDMLVTGKMLDMMCLLSDEAPIGPALAGVVGLGAAFGSCGALYTRMDGDSGI